MSCDVVVLGAGFSKAVNDLFPTTDELGEKVRSRLRENTGSFPAHVFDDGRFEEWLSYIAELQPHHDDRWTLEAKALGIRVTEQVQQILVDAQRSALVTHPHEWFYQLLALMHVRRATIITFNYDTLIECGVETMRLPAPSSNWQGVPRAIREEDILGGLPKSAVPTPPQDIHRGPFDLLVVPGLADMGWAATFQLLKLHGSLSWYWLPNSGSSSSLRRWRLPGNFGDVWSDDEESQRRELPRHEAFVVPPSMLKGAHLQEPVARELWHRAASAMAKAERVVLIGYSMPIADQSFSGLLTEGLGSRTVRVEVVNPKWDEVQGRLVRLGIPKGRIAVTCGNDCVERWVTEEIERVGRSVVESLRGEPLSGNERLFVANPRADGVSAVEPEGTCVVLQLHPRGHVAAQPVASSSLLEQLDGATSLVVEDDGRRLPVLDYWRTKQPVSYSMEQLHFVTTGVPSQGEGGNR